MSDFDIAVIGAGAWGTALAVLNVRAGRRVALWARDPARAAAMAASRENPRLKNVSLPPNLVITNKIPPATTTLLAVPMQYLRATLGLLPPSPTNLVLCCKGLETGTLLLPQEVAATFSQNWPTAILTGPNFALEVASGLPAAAVLATSDEDLRRLLIDALHTDTLRLYGSADIVGAALAGAAKNVIAVAAGVVIGAGLGENARAALITRGIAEIARLATALGGKADTISGLSGLGDLLLTCTGPASRNYSLGLALGQGETLADILSRRTSVTEGVVTAPALLARALNAGVEMPIVQNVASLLAGEVDTRQTIASLMGRALRDE